MGNKKCVDIKMFWYADQLVIPMYVTIITTVGREGVINAAPYSLGTPYNISSKKPQIDIGVRKSSHTYNNIIETKEFVINFPPFKYLNDIIETARFWPKDENELSHTSFTEINSQKVVPPSIKECKQHIECRLHAVQEMDSSHVHIVGDILSIVIDEELVNMDRKQRIEELDLPLYIGDERRKYFFFGRMNEIKIVELKPPEPMRKATVITKIPWEDAALKQLYKVPSFIQETVIEIVEEEAYKSAEGRVTYEFFKNIEDQYAPKEVQERFD